MDKYGRSCFAVIALVAGSFTGASAQTHQSSALIADHILDVHTGRLAVREAWKSENG